jgi:hypothetical protein
VLKIDSKVKFSEEDSVENGNHQFAKPGSKRTMAYTEIRSRNLRQREKVDYSLPPLRSQSEENRPKKLKIQPTISTSNAFETLQVHDAMDIEPASSSQQFRPPLRQSPPQGAATSKPKPIIVWSSSHEAVKLLTSSLKLNLPADKLKAPGAYQLSPASLEDKKKIIEKLQASQQPYHTYTEPADRQTEFLMLNFELMEAEQVLKLLKESNIPAKRVFVVRKHTSVPIYKVCFDKNSMTLNSESHGRKLTREQSGQLNASVAKRGDIQL